MFHMKHSDMQGRKKEDKKMVRLFDGEVIGLRHYEFRGDKGLVSAYQVFFTLQGVSDVEGLCCGHCTVTSAHVPCVGSTITIGRVGQKYELVS